ncbi:MAG: tripartite tricarboxylate transporter permease [Roseibium sp.]|uniref:tripartite tricarboxylate transporter permease n=1 Tax=Roseibium sp. TaxID=1936156 RepID=UPI00260571FD|nr:tripartite tricarboxylate transporter permease [Roseibium sp.]MCV0424182.1 tripartite tricarboxylate transporter permease [Roseibium sp.]
MSEIILGFSTVFSEPLTLGLILAGALCGVLVGALPGLTAAAAIALLFPLTFHLEPLPALALLYVLGKAGRYGGSISAILFNTPGTAASAATMLDGYPMTRKGQAGKALKVSAVASAFGDFLGELLLIFGAVKIAVFTKTLGPPEYFAIMMMAFVVIGSVVGESVVKGLIATATGGFLALVGTDPISGYSRMTLGFPQLEDGFTLVPLLIGLFVFAEVLVQAEMVHSKGDEDVNFRSSREGSRLPMPEFLRLVPTMFRSSVIGSLIGMLPGLGSSVACFVAYGEERRRSKRSGEWGTGVPEGVAAPEAANNAVSGPSMIPLLTLGIPGSTIAAILIGVFTIHGIQVGPMIFDREPALVFGLFSAGLIGILAYGLIGYFGAPLVGRMIAYLPPRIIYPFVFVTAFSAVYSGNNSVFDIGVALIFGVIGYAMRKSGFPIAAFIIGFVLARGAEEAFRQSLLLSDNGFGIFLERPVAIACFAIAALVSVLRGAQSLRRTKSHAKT